MVDPHVNGRRRRMPAEQRRSEILHAAVEVFAEYGYTEATTDQVARVAGVSQPYVVRMFGGKHALFIAAHAQVFDRIESVFRAAVAERDPSLAPIEALGLAYLELVPDRNVLRMMQHGFTVAADPRFGSIVRDCLVRIYRLVRELSGVSAEEARTFIAHGLLINTLVTVQLAQVAGDDPYAAELVRTTLGEGALPTPAV